MQEAFAPLSVLDVIGSLSVARRKPRLERGYPCPVPASRGWHTLTWVDGMAGVLLSSAMTALKFDIHRHGTWQLDHKLRQASVFNHFVSGSAPRTMGLEHCVRLAGRSELRSFLAELFPSGYVVKAARGAGSGDAERFDCSGKLETILGRIASRPDLATCDVQERWVVQERLAIAQEYRIHSFEDEVLPNLSGERYAFAKTRGLCDGAVVAVRSLLDRLPPALVGEAVWSWDLAETLDGKAVIIEGNVTGVHRMVTPGFHCSGFFSNPTRGPSLLIELFRHLREAYGLGMPFIAAPPVPERHRAYWQMFSDQLL